MTQKQTRKNRTPKPIPAMLVGSFETALENRIAEFNNALALEGRLTNDPAFQMLRSIRRELVKLEVASFTRIPRALVAAPVEASAPKKTRKRRSNTETTEAAAPVQSREVDPSEVETLQARGSISDSAPYGTDSEGTPLAPYGVKKSGAPMKRRGRVAGVSPAVKETPAQASSEETPEAEEPETETEDDVDEELPEPTGLTASASEATSDDEDEDEDDDDDEGIMSLLDNLEL